MATLTDKSEEKPDQNGPGARAEAARRERQAEALRANLARRKQQQRERAIDDPTPSEKPGPEKPRS